MSRVPFIAIFGVTAAIATVAADAHAQPCTGSVDGHVVDAVTHEPIPGATVTLDGAVVASTDEAGRFELGGLCAGEHAVTVERADYTPGERAVTLATHASIELELYVLDEEVIVVVEDAPDPVDMRSVAKLSGEVLEKKRGHGLAETLSEVPGVGQLRSSSGMAKPIVRGQYGRRLLLMVDGVRHRAQEWGLDHVPEIDPFIADEIAVVRGAAGVRHGPDAIGGAVLVTPPDLLDEPGVAAEAHLIGMTNGVGGAVAGRLQSASARWPGLAWNVDASVKRVAAPSTPDYPLDNTGAREWSVGATIGYRDYRLSYRHYQATLGVCTCLRVESRDDFLAQLERETPIGVELYESEMSIDRPYQAVAHELALLRARWSRGALGAIVLTNAFQYDHRREYDIVRDATTGPQFDFRLFTDDLDLALEHRPVHLSDHLHLRGSAGVVGMVQVHEYGGLPLVPDHRSIGGGVYAIERVSGHDFELEAGLRYDVVARTASIIRQDFLRLVRSGQLAEDACGTSDADPVDCASTFHTVSASIGGLYQLTRPWSVKLDLSTASRPPNTDEQYLNGTSPTFPVLALGKPDLGAETTYSASATTTYQGEQLAAEASVYANHIDDYIELAPALDENGDPIFDVLIRGTFPRFVTRPVDAVFYGADGGVDWTPVPWLTLGGQLSMVRARNVSEDRYLVFVPADRARGAVTVRRGPSFLTVAGTYVAQQDRYDINADFAPPPDAYFLLGADAGTEVGEVKLAVSGTNLGNARYRDYTGLLRYFADQPGWQVLLRMSVELDD